MHFIRSLRGSQGDTRLHAQQTPIISSPNMPILGWHDQNAESSMRRRRGRFVDLFVVVLVVDILVAPAAGLLRQGTGDSDGGGLVVDLPRGTAGEPVLSDLGGVAEKGDPAFLPLHVDQGKDDGEPEADVSQHGSDGSVI